MTHDGFQAPLIFLGKKSIYGSANRAFFEVCLVEYPKSRD